ncbi:MAG: ABC transporter ATP-binding protein [Candidatus Omnitrophica bacterium]|nr:ABC transporter ATP-binding protein [Candidatus Omnitrophota bacterium]
MRNAVPVEVLKGIDLELRAGELAAVVGPSGAGKSTLINCLAGIDLPTRGEVRIGGQILASLSDRERARLRHERVGLVFQFFHLLHDLTAAENVLLASRLYPDRKVPDALKRANRLLDLLGLGSRADHHPSELSGGEMQRVAIARALMMNPSILLCDEPTGNLDSVNGENIIQTLTRFAREDKKTVLIVTHDDRISRVADRVLRMKDGLFETSQR